MLYAKIVLGLPVEGPFDYLVPEADQSKIAIGQRVKVSFGVRRMIGYVVGLSRDTEVKKLKSLSAVIDEFPVLDTFMLQLSKKLSEYYCCSWGEAIETALPDFLRKGRAMPDFSAAGIKQISDEEKKFQGVLVQAGEEELRWKRYFQEISLTLALKRQVIVVLPDVKYVLKAREFLKSKFGDCVGAFYRKQKLEQDIWAMARNGKFKIVVGTRSCIFAPLPDLGLVVVEDENDSVYKQDQVPHYHLRDVAFMRANLEGARLILGSSLPSLESVYLSRKEKFEQVIISGEKKPPEIKIIDMKNFLSMTKRKDTVFSRYLEDAILAGLNSGKKALLFINRKGFATNARCMNCGKTLKCPRCEIGLVYHFEDDLLKCHHCSYEIKAPKICPQCNQGYIKYSGLGTEKIESELTRIFPQAKINRLDKKIKIRPGESNIFVATSAIIKEAEILPRVKFDLIGVLAIDASLSRMDYRSSEKVFALLVELQGLASEKLVIQTNIPKHHMFQALERNDLQVFYEEELEERNDLGFPPYKHHCLVKLRGKLEQKTKDSAEKLFSFLKGNLPAEGVEVVAVSPGMPAKLRGNFYYQVLLKGDSGEGLTKFLKLILKDFRHSGVILTVDVDPL